MDEVGHRSLGHAAEGLAGRLGEALGTCLVISGDVEGDEEHQIRGQDAHAGESGEFLTRALAGIGPLRLVS